MIEILLLVLSFILQGFGGEKRVCSKEGSPIKCCPNYKFNGEKCTPCYGYYGPQCARSCVPGYCGFGCETKCLCEQCNQVNCSCSYDQDGSHFPESITVLTVVVIGICFVTAMMMAGYIIRSIISRNKKKDKDNQLPSFRTMGSHISLHGFERAIDNHYV